MREQVKGIIVFALMAAVLLGALRLLSWIPEAIDEGALRRFASVEEARSHLKIARIYLPAFYPASVRWPPTLIGGQTTPYPAVIFEFGGADRKGVFLAITQTRTPHRPLQEPIRIVAIREKVSYPFKGRTALLEVGACADGTTCSRFTWDENGDRLSLVLRSSPVELVRIAESMIPRGESGSGAAQ